MEAYTEDGLYRWTQDSARQHPGLDTVVVREASDLTDGRVLSAIVNLVNTGGEDAEAIPIARAKVLNHRTQTAPVVVFDPPDDNHVSAMPMDCRLSLMLPRKQRASLKL